MNAFIISDCRSILEPACPAAAGLPPPYLSFVGFSLLNEVWVSIDLLPECAPNPPPVLANSACSLDGEFTNRFEYCVISFRSSGNVKSFVLTFCGSNEWTQLDTRCAYSSMKRRLFWMLTCDSFC